MKRFLLPLLALALSACQTSSIEVYTTHEFGSKGGAGFSAHCTTIRLKANGNAGELSAAANPAVGSAILNHPSLNAPVSVEGSCLESVKDSATGAVTLVETGHIQVTLSPGNHTILVGSSEDVSPATLTAYVQGSGAKVSGIYPVIQRQ